ncbi:MAG: hypothetical protein KDD82_13615 [Planctomycetes bacterium]|nr:hypothetical protein [Planctomycetota bacterium]
MDLALLLTQLASTWYMVGLIWLVQLVHYPLMARVGPEHAVSYEQAHVRLMGYVVGPPMLVEAAGVVLLAGFGAPWATPLEAWLGAGLLAGVWATTALCSVPAHTRLEQAFDPAVHRRLVRTNWIRTALWSARGLLVLLWAARSLG